MKKFEPVQGRSIPMNRADVDTDQIISKEFLKRIERTGFGPFAFDDWKQDPDFVLNNPAFKGAPLMVTGPNFGCGSSREQAVSCLKGHDLIIVANDFARIFLQNGINLGLRMIACPGIEANEGDELEITADAVVNKTSGKQFKVDPMPRSRQVIIDAGGLIPYTRKRVVEKAGAA